MSELLTKFCQSSLFFNSFSQHKLREKKVQNSKYGKLSNIQDTAKPMNSYTNLHTEKLSQAGYEKNRARSCPGVGSADRVQAGNWGREELSFHCIPLGCLVSFTMSLHYHH